jgi:hypothetical protein
MELAMRLALIILVLVPLLPLGRPAAAQPYPMPPGSYRQQCTDLYMQGQFLHGYCRGPGGEGESSINVLSCSTGVFVDATGALTCIGPGGGAPPAYVPSPGPGYAPRPGYAPGPGYGPGPGYAPGRGYGPGPGHSPGPGYSRGAAVLYARPGWRGPSIVVGGPTPNLADLGLNDRVRSIRLDPGAEPWLVCDDTDFRGRCVTIDRSIGDTGQIGIGDRIASIRPLR